MIPAENVKVRVTAGVLKGNRVFIALQDENENIVRHVVSPAYTTKDVAVRLFELVKSYINRLDFEQAVALVYMIDSFQEHNVVLYNSPN